MSWLSLVVDRAGPGVRKAAFANRVRSFANPVAGLLQLPGFKLLWISSAAAAVLAIVTGALGTEALEPGPRSLFWAMLLGWNFLKWQTWFAFTVRKPADWTRAALAGGILLNLTLPIEIVICLRAVGVGAAPEFARVWFYALVISLALFAVIRTAVHGTRSRAIEAVSGPPALALSKDGLLARAGIVPDMLIAVRAEDHFCRVHRVDGSSALVHYRFADALTEMAGLDGAQVHRGIWVAACANRGATPERRRWRLLLADGSSVPVSASRVAEARHRGWLRRAGGPPLQ